MTLASRTTRRLLPWFVAAAVSAAAEVRGAGVIVEQVTKASPAERAGIASGDVLVSWSRGESKGVFDSPLDVEDVETEQGSRGPVTVKGTREGEARTFVIAWAPWGLGTHPVLTGVALRMYRDGATLMAEQPAVAAGRWCQAAEGERLRPDAARWLLVRAARTLAESSAYAESDALYERLLNATPLGEPALRAALLLEWGATLQKRGQFVRAEERYLSALLLCVQLEPTSLRVARCHHEMGRLAHERGEVSTRRAAEGFHRDALALREELAPESTLVAESLTSLGTVMRAHGDWDAAERLCQESVRILDVKAPVSFLVARNMMILSDLQGTAGDIDAAFRQLLRALAIVEKLPGGSLYVARTLNNLGNTALQVGDLPAAEAYHRRSLTIKRQIGAGKLDIAFSLGNLARVLHAAGDLEAAETFKRQDLEIREDLTPGSSEMAEALGDLGELLAERGDLTGAEHHQRRALAIAEKLVESSVLASDIHRNLAMVAYDRRDLLTAEEHCRRALAIVEKIAPGTTRSAEVLYRLGLVYRLQGDRGRAAELLCRAIEDLETQGSRLGGTQERRASYMARFADFYRDYIDLLVELGQEEAAFRVLERSRARALLSMLAERSVLTGLPPELAKEAKRISREHDRVQTLLAASRDDALEESGHLIRLLELRREAESLTKRLRALSPRLASLRYPEPLGLAATRAALDAGTALLSYSVGRDRTLLFAVTQEPPGLAVSTIPVGRERLKERVARFRSLIARGQSSPEVSPALFEGARALFRDLVAPASAILGRADRVLISADGPIHALPFAALIRDVPSGAPPYFVAWKPLHTVASATVYAELKRSRRSRTETGPSLVAFGDPSYPPRSQNEAEGSSDADLRSAAHRGLAFRPLPATRREVAGIAALYRERARTFLGADATEERARSLGRDVDNIHFACHGFLDEDLPMSSGLVLSIPGAPAEGRGNGLLQAWEILDSMRIDADLVTLSACATALGKETGGEGLVGLSRAFQYAGARSVLASLWSVSDESTADLMQRFYRYLEEGKTKDAALRSAQMDALSAHPFHWASFELIGDWR